MPKKAKEKTENLTVTLEYEKPKKFWRYLLIIFGSILLSLIILFFIARRKVDQYLTAFSTAAQVSEASVLSELTKINQQAIEYYQFPEKTLNEQTVLILGGDQLEGRDGDPILTDTILLIKINLQSGLVKIMSLPRDIYNEAYLTKINALYHYGLERDSENPLAFPEEVLSEITGLKIDQSLIVNIEDLEALIDLLGGVEVEVPIAFTDPLFPRQGVDVSLETDPAVLYQEVSFEEGVELMTGRRALQYMRSRHSGDDEGTDLARAARQNLVLGALVNKLSDLDQFIKKPALAGQLYRFYLDNFAQDLTLDEIYQISLSLIFNFYQAEKTELQLEIENFPITVYPDDNSGLIYNPPLWQTNQDWRYQIRDPELFKTSIQQFFQH